MNFIETLQEKSMMFKVKCGKKLDGGNSGSESALKVASATNSGLHCPLISEQLSPPIWDTWSFPFLFRAVSSICLLGRDIASSGAPT